MLINRLLTGKAQTQTGSQLNYPIPSMLYNLYFSNDQNNRKNLSTPSTNLVLLKPGKDTATKENRSVSLINTNINILKYLQTGHTYIEKITYSAQFGFFLAM